jgi:SPP1 family predicted phage head-tail adaptor
MRAGKLDRRIAIERQTQTVSPAGTVSSTWQAFVTARAEIVQQSALEFLREHGEAERIALIFRIRWPSQPIVTTDRVQYQGAAYDLVEIKELGRRRGLELRCELVK